MNIRFKELAQNEAQDFIGGQAAFGNNTLLGAFGNDQLIITSPGRTGVGDVAPCDVTPASGIGTVAAARSALEGLSKGEGAIGFCE